MKVKKSVERLSILVFALLFIFSLVNIVSAQTVLCNPTIILVNQDPNPANPDSYVNVLFEVTGLGDCNKGYSVKIDPQYPFSLDSNATSTFTINGNIYASQAKDVWMIPVKLKVDKDAFDGNYNIDIKFHEGNDGLFNGYYASKSYNLSIEDSRTQFDAVIQDSTSSEVSIAIANVGKYTANSVVVRIPEQDSFTVSGTDGQMVGNLDSGDYTIVGFEVSKKVQTPTAFQRDVRNSTSSSLQQLQDLSSAKLKFDIYYTDNIGERRVANMELKLNNAVNSSAMIGNFPRRTNTTNSSFFSKYKIWIIILGIFGLLLFTYKKYPVQTKNFFNKMNLNKKGSVQLDSEKETPQWVRRAKEKEKK